ncbi:efflux transporter outer membrane subunit [Motilimonas eburnea]|uniref:efflux transporter outer membrane subunit n=1 Tax=Motilimonas eburnea TaxID=1737488 RepID=UPI001E386398|nr:efflux transporter outer membrane subunit [Motilimonas eburnea]MCE2573461.1 efflux transporter outer membrane subunit [Motilimonas eburnea]
MKTAKLTIIALSIALTGCSLAPNYEKPEAELTTHYLYQEQTQGVSGEAFTDNGQWWQAFNDDVLNSLIERTQAQNLSLQMAGQQIKAAQAYQTAVASFKVPTVALGAGYLSYGLSENDPLLGPAITAKHPETGQSLNLVEQDSGAFTAGASISWELDLFGRIEHQSKAAAIRAEQAEIYRTGLNTLITSDLTNNYLQYRGAQQRLQIARNNIAEQTEMLELVKKLSASGYGSELDVAQASSLLAATKASEPQLVIAKKVHLHRMAMLMGVTPAALQGELAQSAALPEYSSAIPVGLPADLLTRRPDIALAEREMAAINEKLGAAIANKYPKVYLTGSPGLVAKDFSDLFSSSSTAWLASVGVRWNIFDGGRTDAMIDLENSRFEHAALNYQHSVNNALNEVETWLVVYGNSQQYQKQVAEATLQAQSAVSKAESLYAAGLIDYISVLDAQRQQNTLQDAYVVAQLQTVNAVVALQKALGGDWEI